MTARPMSLLHLAIAATLALGTLASTPSQATSTSQLELVIVTQHPQTGDLCYGTVPVLSSGIPYQTIPLAAFEEGLAWDTNLMNHVNINRLVSVPPMDTVATRMDDSTPTVELDVSVDLTALANAHQSAGISASATRDQAKLGLLALARNLGRLTNQNYALQVSFVGLPGGVLALGEKPLAITWTYTPSSPRLRGYQNELINVFGTCN